MLLRALGRRLVIIGAASVAVTQAAPVAAQQRPPFYGVYALVQGRLVEIPEADKYEPGDGTIIAGSPGLSFNTGRISFVVYDRALLLGTPREAFVYIVPRIRFFIDRSDRTGTPERRVDITALKNLEFERAARSRGPYWIVRRTAYTLRVSPYGTANDMVLLRWPNSSFEFPPGRYRLRLGSTNYDFMVRPSSPPGPGHCIDATEIGPPGGTYPRFEDCRVDVPTPPRPVKNNTAGRVATSPAGRNNANPNVTDLDIGTAVPPLRNIWRERPYSGDGFVVSSPADFNLQVLRYKSVGTLHWYTATIGTYGASVEVYDAPEQEDADQILAHTEVSDPRTIVGGVLRSSRRISLSGFPGSELVYEGSVVHVRARIYVVGRFVYEVHASSPIGQQPWPDEERFLSSFRLLKE